MGLVRAERGVQRMIAALMETVVSIGPHFLDRLLDLFKGLIEAFQVLGWLAANSRGE